MNTPRKKKRHNPERFSADIVKGFDGTWTGAIQDPEMGLALANVIVTFEHLEDLMAQILAALSGTDDLVTAQYMMQAIKSPRGRRDILRALLEKAPRNVAADEFFDDVISRYDDVSARRNQFVHGLWYSEVRTGNRILLAKSNELGIGLLTASPIASADVRALVRDIVVLQRDIALNAQKHGVALLPAHRRPPPPIRPELINPGPSDAAEAAPPPESSEA